MASVKLTRPGRLFLSMLLAAATVLTSAGQAGAHSGNTDPNVIHACVNKSSGAVKIIGLAGACASNHSCPNWR